MRCRTWNEVAQEWEGGDEDGFAALHRTWWSRDDYVAGGGVVVLRPLGLGGHPMGNLWARYGRVNEHVREQRNVVSVHVREERPREWCSHEQVHVAFFDNRFRAFSWVNRAGRAFCGVELSQRFSRGWLFADDGIYGVIGRMLGRDGAGAHIQVKPWGIAYG